MISRSTRRERWSAGSSGAWRWPGSTIVERYLELLARDGAELQHLADDLFINVTRFFRDPKAFELLAEKIIPELVRAQPPDRPIRVWVAGCSTGEEAYSIAMLFLEEIAAARRNLKLQIFASDIDADAVAVAREGLYPPSIEADVPPAAADPLLHPGRSRLSGVARAAARRSCSPSMTWWPMRRFRASI